MLRATSAFSYLCVARVSYKSLVDTSWHGTHPIIAVKMVSSFDVRYSTVGHRLPICLRRRLLKICETSFRACR